MIATSPDAPVHARPHAWQEPFTGRQCMKQGTASFAGVRLTVQRGSCEPCERTRRAPICRDQQQAGAGTSVGRWVRTDHIQFVI